MNAYCSLLRSHTPQEELKEDGCLLREQYMAEQIAKACREYGKVLVVTGGFHVDGLKGLLSEKDGELSYVGDCEDLFSHREALCICFCSADNRRLRSASGPGFPEGFPRREGR